MALPSVVDRVAATGSQFTLTAVVRNEGDEASPSTTLRYYRSADATVATSDTAEGTAAVAGLAASGSSSQSVDVTAPSTSGTYYYGACVDSVAGESDTSNNCSASVRVRVSAVEPPRPPPQTHPDLVVESPSVSDGSPAAGAGFTLSATVRNAGDGASAGTTLRYYRSTDATIATSDTAEGTDPVGGLAASGSSSQSVDVTAPSTSGTYYYGACVDSVAGESDTANNCSASVQVTVSVVESPPPPPQTHPDLVVESPSVSDGSPAAGAGFTLSATVRNAGDGASAGTTLRYYRSTDATITTSDTAAGTDPVGGLAASGSSSQSVDVTAPSTSGTYYYGACVDSVAGESDTANNCSASVPVTVPEPPSPTSPDLTVGSPAVSDITPETEGSFTLSATVSNEGDGSSASTTLRYYRSTDTTVTTSDTEVGTDAIGGLSAGASSSESIGLTAPSTAATYYYGACVDSVTGESDTTNNCSGSVQVTVSAPPPPTNPDLVVGSPSVTDSSLETGDSFTLSATVENAGDGASAATTLRYYRSTDATVTTSDAEVGTDAVGGLSAGASSSESIGLTAPSTAATYYYGACVDSVTGESDTTNNCSGSVQVTVTVPEEGEPDLEIRSIGTFISGVGNTYPGESFQIAASVRNDGDGPAEATTLRIYRSSDTTVDTSDTQVGTAAVAGLAASEGASATIRVTSPLSPGTYYYGACVDSVTGESDTTNNCGGPLEVPVVPRGQPDLVVEPPTLAPAFPAGGATFTLTTTVWNFAQVVEGTSEATTLRYYLSTDSAISTSDTQVGTDAVPALGSRGRSTQSVELTAPSTPGTYHYGACVDAVSDESDTTNNCSRSRDVVVREP